MSTAPVVDQPAAVAAESRPLSSSKRVRKALDALAKEEARQARWEASAFAKQAELDNMRGRVGTDVVDAPEDEAEELAQRLTREVADLAAAVETARATVAACEPKVMAAKRAVLQAEADDVRDELEQLRRRKTEHDRKLEVLLAQLVEHDGAKYEAWEPSQLDRAMAGAASLTWTESRSARLAREVSGLEARLSIAEAAARGESLLAHQHLPLEVFSPRVKGPEAYFPELLAQ